MTNIDPAEKINFEDAHKMALRISGTSPHVAENLYVDTVLTLMVHTI